MIGVWLALFQIVIFPGFLFLSALSLVFEYVDRKLYARMQNRVGPPWYQPLADIVKLLSKEDDHPLRRGAARVQRDPGVRIRGNLRGVSLHPDLERHVAACPLTAT